MGLVSTSMLDSQSLWKRMGVFVVDLEDLLQLYLGEDTAL